MPRYALDISKSSSLLSSLNPLKSTSDAFVDHMLHPAREYDSPIADKELDLRGVMCPFNFVKTKLQLEAMADGAILTVMLDHGEPLKNVPASVEVEGHTILKIEPMESYVLVWIQKHNT